MLRNPDILHNSRCNCYHISETFIALQQNPYFRRLITEKSVYQERTTSMKVKIDTKEKFHVITIEDENLTANMTGELNEKLLSFRNGKISNIILRMGAVKQLDIEAAKQIEKIQQAFYEHNCSLVICELQKQVEQFLDEKEVLEFLNITPTESEAWDIVQMEEIERELF